MPEPTADDRKVEPVVLNEEHLDRFMSSGRVNEVFPKFPADDAAKAVAQSKDPSCPVCVRRRLFTYRGAIRKGLLVLKAAADEGNEEALNRIKVFKEAAGLAGPVKVTAVHNGKRTEFVV